MTQEVQGTAVETEASTTYTRYRERERVCIYLEPKEVVAKISVINNGRIETLSTQYGR